MFTSYLVGVAYYLVCLFYLSVPSNAYNSLTPIGLIKVNLKSGGG